VPNPAFLALAGLIALLVLIPTRRLQIAGWTTRGLAAYYLAIVGLALLVAGIRGPVRFLVPILLIAYLAPFVTARAGIDRLLGRRDGQGPRNVTPPGDGRDG
jgi:hypothetical protein